MNWKVGKLRFVLSNEIYKILLKKKYFLAQTIIKAKKINELSLLQRAVLSDKK